MLEIWITKDFRIEFSTIWNDADVELLCACVNNKPIMAVQSVNLYIYHLYEYENAPEKLGFFR